VYFCWGSWADSCAASRQTVRYARVPVESKRPAVPNIGDWVASDYSRGVWRVFRVELNFYDLRYNVTEPKVRGRALVFATKLLNDAWKRSFSTVVWSAALVHPLNEEQSDRLLAALAADPDLLAKFDRYVPKPIDLVCNLRFGPVPGGFEAFSEEVEASLGSRIAIGLCLDEILPLIASSGLSEYMNRNPGVGTLQLNSPNHLRRGDEFVFTSFRALNF
jgi:hypothetical protein